MISVKNTSNKSYRHCSVKQLRIILFLFVCLNILSSITRASDLKFSDSTLVLGEIIKKSYISKRITSFCSKEADLLLDEGVQLYVINKEICSNSDYKKKNIFYQVAYNGGLFYIESDRINLKTSFPEEEIKNMSSDKFNSWKLYVTSQSKILYVKEEDEANNYFNKAQRHGLVLLSWTMTQKGTLSNITGVRLNFYNPTNKIIKYITTKLIAYNPVGDEIIDRNNKTSIVTVKSIGPLRPQEVGSYDFSNLWYSNLIESAKIINIKVEYMDGSVKTINSISEITAPKRYATKKLN
jgi:hypothetical protein